MELLAAIASGAVKAQMGARFPLSAIVEAHAAAEARAFAGSLILAPG